MAQATWEKTADSASASPAKPSFRLERLKFLIGGGLILAAIAYLLISGTMSGAQYFITVDELKNNAAYLSKPVRISGAVIGDTIQYDSQNLIIEFTIANIPSQVDDLAVALNRAVNDPQAARLNVRVENQVKPDLLQHEAQAILTGTLDNNGVFHATELLLKCPSRFQENVPAEAVAAQSETQPRDISG